jgi:hypothetical protein
MAEISNLFFLGKGNFGHFALQVLQCLKNTCGNCWSSIEVYVSNPYVSYTLQTVLSTATDTRKLDFSMHKCLIKLDDSGTNYCQQTCNHTENLQDPGPPFLFLFPYYHTSSIDYFS